MVKVICHKCKKVFEDKLFDKLNIKYDIQEKRTYCNQCINILYPKFKNKLTTSKVVL
jgi:RNase P subunit RPR2